MNRAPSSNRHPGLVPGSTAQRNAKPEPLVPGLRHGGSRDEPGMTLKMGLAAGDLA